MNGGNVRVHPQAFRDAAGAQWMLFADGENFAIRGREHLATKGVKVPECARHVPDSFLWLPGYSGDQLIPDLNAARLASFTIRSHYYTTARGGSEQLDKVRKIVTTAGFHAEVFPRTKERNAKGVDITLARDMLIHAFSGHFDTAILVAGDGDYVPLVNEVKRHGRRVVLAFFDCPALSPELRLSADAFFDLSGTFAGHWGQYIEAEAKKAKEAAA